MVAPDIKITAQVPSQAVRELMTETTPSLSQFSFQQKEKKMKEMKGVVSYMSVLPPGLPPNELWKTTRKKEEPAGQTTN